MKKSLALFAVAVLGIVATAPAAIIFNPANPTFIDDAGGFAGTSSVAVNPYTQARLVFTFSGLNPSPLPSSFQITNILLKGDGITGSLSYGSVTFTANETKTTAYVNLSSSVFNLNFANNLVSFDLPGGNVISDGAQLSVFVRYASADLESNIQTSPTGPIFEAQNVGPEPIPEPGTWAAAALLGWRCSVHALAPAPDGLS